MNTQSMSGTPRLRALATVFAVAAVLVSGIFIWSDAMSSISASNGTITIGTHPPKLLAGGPIVWVPVYDQWGAITNPPHTPIIKG